MTEPLITQLPEPYISRGVAFDQFQLTGPHLDHRGSSKGVRLLVPCDLAALDACLQRLPQDKPRMGFRVNVDLEPWMLKANGNWATAKISKKDGRRMGWAIGELFVDAQGICFRQVGITTHFYRRAGTPDLPRIVRIAQVIAGFCQKLNADPSGIRDYGLDATTHCMCCGKGLTVDKSKMRGVGPSCLAVLERFLGLGTDQTIAEMEGAHG
jgi:hypothetical protein